MDKILENIKTRRSVRRYRPDAVPQEFLDKIAEAGLFAASGRGRQGTLLFFRSRTRLLETGFLR